MNLNDLLKIDINDLQKIDYKKLAEEFCKRPDVLINIAAVIITLFILISGVSARQKESKNLRANIEKLKEKVEAIREYQTAQESLEEFRNTIPKALPEDELVSTLTDWAVKRDIQIESFSPTKTESTALSDIITIELMLSLKDYKNLWLFINDIEKSTYALRINDWQGYLASDMTKAKDSNDSLLKIKLSLSTVKIKND